MSSNGRSGGRRGRPVNAESKEKPGYSEPVTGLDDTYLPFDETVLLDHFVPDPDGAGDRQRHLTYYRRSLDRVRGLEARRDPTRSDTKSGRQIEKDERFWVVAALMALYHADSESRAERFADLLQRAGLKEPAGHANWAEALSGPLRLYFEVSIPSRRAYKDHLRRNLDHRMSIPHLRELASKSKRYEGATRLDAVLLATDTGAAVFFEAKVLSDVSTKVEYDIMRNQLARIIDASLDKDDSLHPDLNSRNPESTAVVLLTPESLSSRSPIPGASRNRLYGFLLPEYQDPDSELLGWHLPHRTAEELRGMPDRLGWATWEDCNRVLPGACAWLD